MADNYLEKKMEEHRSQGGRHSLRPRLTPRGRRPGELLVEFTPCPVVVHDVTHPAMTGAARELAAAGFKVCFTLGDIHRGTRLAATLGASFLPPGMPLPDDAIHLSADSGAWLLRRGSSGLRVTVPTPDPAPAETTSAPGESPATLPQTIAWGAAMLANLNVFQENVFKNIKIEGLSF